LKDLLSVICWFLSLCHFLILVFSYFYSSTGNINVNNIIVYITTFIVLGFLKLVVNVC
jgi:hypothetical protein